MMTPLMRKELRRRRNTLLVGIAANELADMRRKVTGETDFMNAFSLRMLVLDNWDDYADQIRHWCEFTITGEPTL